MLKTARSEEGSLRDETPQAGVWEEAPIVSYREAIQKASSQGAKRDLTVGLLQKE